jgi:hypothetical protein
MSDHSFDRDRSLAQLAMRAGFCGAFAAVVLAAVFSVFRFIAG